MTIDEELNSLEDGVRRLKIEFDVFFGGGSKKPPTDLEWRVQSLIKRFSDGRRLTFAQRFRFSAIQQKYAVYNSLWQQKLRIKEEGYRRPQDALLSIQGVRQFDESGPAAADANQPFRMAFSDVEAEQTKVEALYEAMLETRKKLKARGSAGTLESFQEFVRKKTKQLREEYGAHAVEYSIEIEKDQVRLKARAQNGNKQ